MTPTPYIKIFKENFEYYIISYEYTGLRMDERTGNSITVSWDQDTSLDETSEFDTYRVRVNYDDGTLIKTPATKETTYKIEGLSVGVKYNIAVRVETKLSSTSGPSERSEYCPDLAAATDDDAPDESRLTKVENRLVRLPYKIH